MSTAIQRILRTSVPALAAAAACPVIPLSAEGPDAAAGPPNVVFFLADDLGYGDPGYMGSERARTPHLDAFAAENLNFTSAYAPAPQCSPTRASILTGQYPARTHITVWIGGNKPDSYKNLRLPRQKQYLSADHYTLGEYFQERGYRTGQIGKWHVGGRRVSPQEHGFDEVIGYSPGAGPGPARAWYGPYAKIRDLEGPEDEYITDRLTDEAIGFMERNRERPFFLMLQHYDVHAPLTAPEEDVEKYVEMGEPRKKGRENATFLAMKERLDASFGRVVAALEDLDLADNTIVVFFSDNGGVSYFARNAPLRAGKKWLYEGGIRVPMLLRVPGVTSAGTTDIPVNGIDFFPTLVELTGGDPAEVDSFLDGVSFVPLLRGGKLEREALFWHIPQYGKDWKVIPPQGVVRRGKWKLIHYYGHTAPPELYNLEEDIAEQRNLARRHPDRVAAMTRLLMTHLEETEAQQVEVME